jgi:hypothetical protein
MPPESEYPLVLWKVGGRDMAVSVIAFVHDVQSRSGMAFIHIGCALLRQLTDKLVIDSNQFQVL